MMKNTSPVVQYFFFGIQPSGRADFMLVHANGGMTMLSLTMAEVWDQLVNRHVQCVDLSKEGIARSTPPPGVPKKRW